MEETLPYLRSFEDMHFVFLPGKDAGYAAHLKAVFEGMKLPKATVLEYVDDMAALMHACDLASLTSGGLTVTECLCAELPMILLGKSYGQENSNTAMLTSFLMHACDLASLTSGGLTVTECLCAELPMILLGKSYGQENSNTAMLTSFGATLHATTSRELIIQLRHLHDNSEALHGLLSQIRWIDRHGMSLRRVADDLAGQILRPGEIEYRHAHVIRRDPPCHNVTGAHHATASSP